MEMALQIFVVAVLVLGSTVFAMWRLAPARLKLKLLDSFAPDTGHAWGRWIARLRSGVAQELMQGCNTCARGPAHIQRHKAR